MRRTSNSKTLPRTPTPPPLSPSADMTQPQPQNQNGFRRHTFSFRRKSPTSSPSSSPTTSDLSSSPIIGTNLEPALTEEAFKNDPSKQKYDLTKPFSERLNNDGINEKMYGDFATVPTQYLNKVTAKRRSKTLLEIIEDVTPPGLSPRRPNNGDRNGKNNNKRRSTSPERRSSLNLETQTTPASPQPDKQQKRHSRGSSLRKSIEKLLNINQDPDTPEVVNNELLPPPLLIAAELNELEQMQKLIDEEQVDVNTRFSVDKTTALHRSAKNNNLDAIKFLTSRGALVDAKDEEGRTPLHNAAMQGNREAIHALVFNGADVNARDNKGFTPFMLCVYTSVIDKPDNNVHTNPNLYDNTKSANTDNNNNNNDGSKQSAPETLIDIPENNNNNNNSNNNINNNNDINSKSIAATTGISSSQAAFEARTAKMQRVAADLLTFDAEIDPKNFDGFTPLHMACEAGSLTWVKFLVDKGARVLVRDSLKQTPLVLAIKYNRLDVVKYLLLEDTLGNVAAYFKQRDYLEQNMLHLATQRNVNPEITALVIEVLLTLRKHKLITPEMMRMLASETDATNKNTPLHNAAAYNHLGAVSILSNICVADVNAQNNDGDTPLHLCVRGTVSEDGLISINVNIMKELIMAGAKTNIKNNAKETAKAIMKKGISLNKLL